MPTMKEMYLSLFSTIQIENQRLSLAEHYAFEPRTAYKRLDRSRNYKISQYEIQDFLRDNNIYVLLSDAKMLIDAYDDDKDGDLEFKEFEKLVLPATS